MLQDTYENKYIDTNDEEWLEYCDRMYEQENDYQKGGIKMRIDILKELVTALRLRDYPYNITFNAYPSGGECDIEVKYSNDGVTAIYEHTFGDLFINGLSNKERLVLDNMI